MSITTENLTLTKIDDMLQQAFYKKRLNPESLYVAKEDKQLFTDLVAQDVKDRHVEISHYINQTTGRAMSIVCPPNHPKGIISFSGDREVSA
jgi:hypothetical protein